MCETKWLFHRLPCEIGVIYPARLGLELVVHRVNSYFFTRLPGAQGVRYSAAGRIN